MKSILVVCEGNICRSPMAEGLLAAALPDIQVHSAGLNAMSGMPADEMAVRLMKDIGIDIRAHRAMQINRALCLRADLVLVMTTDQRKHLEHAYPAACGRIFRLAEASKRDIPDPYGLSEKAFFDSLQLINHGVREWLHRIRKV